MRWLPVLLAIALLVMVAAACGGAGKDRSVAVGGSKDVTAGKATTASFLSRYRGDEDDDESTGNQTTDNKDDNDADYDNDRADHEPKGYFDEDDTPVRTYGQAARGSQLRALRALLERYYKVAAASDGKTACSLIKKSLTRSIPEDYGRPPGPVYLRGRTCPAVMSRWFKYAHSKLVGKVKIAGIRV